MTEAPPSPWNVANAVTIARIALVPFFVVALLAADGESVTWRLVATAIFVLAASTDRLDGYLARRDNLVTDLGKMLDPIADKALIGAGLIGLSMLGELPWWVTVVILARELGVTALRFVVLRYGVIAASRGGKLKTVLQAVAISLFLLPLDHLPGIVRLVAVATMAAAVLVTLVTGADYVRQAAGLRHAGRA
ncbi:CDP-diacylglycerol--glycerol-3-phosphate 3-phosphatidyltransferase [Cellulomonas aerilata]|uniref:CDP-diacylglycerol--glycerol-3-phosphate 3-phosphatidyltransferase n=1 Tax=Cellulomonas aerilata TaxID=515326 RepID=UPI0011BE0814|nr:CDP-diacylglycerol--glycerol-3-phosphate 3-phosphatidyltransferase [Cellulomonas aerilata]